MILSESHVYAVKRQDGLIKIGCTHVELRIRFSALRREVKLPFAFIGEETYQRGEDALIRERTLHRIFKAHRMGRKLEWFDITEDQLAEHFPK